MSVLLRSFFTIALAGSVTIASQAQSEASVPPAATTEVATVATPLLSPAQMKDGKYKPYLSKRYSNDQDARAVMHLFARKQRGGFVWLTSGFATIGLIASQTGTKANDSGGTTTFEVTPIGYGILVGLFGGVGIGKLSRFSDSKLYTALASYEQSQTFPDYVKKRIKNKDRKWGNSLQR